MVVDFPDSLEHLTRLRFLGGSTGAVLFENGDGRRFVLKRGTSSEHLREEFTAAEIYRAAGVLVPEQALYYEDSRPLRLAEYVKGSMLRHLEIDERRALRGKVREHFAVDALLANRDVAGTARDNLILTPTGEVYRVDLGGALRYRARGRRKRDFGEVVGELESMRDPRRVLGIFSSLSDEDVARQILELMKRRERILAAAPEDLREILNNRLDYLHWWALNSNEIAS